MQFSIKKKQAQNVNKNVPVYWYIKSKRKTPRPFFYSGLIADIYIRFGQCNDICIKYIYIIETTRTQ